MAQISILSDLFSDTSSFIEITDDVTTNTKIYTLTQDLIIKQSNLHQQQFQKIMENILYLMEMGML